MYSEITRGYFFDIDLDIILILSAHNNYKYLYILQAVKIHFRCKRSNTNKLYPSINVITISVSVIIETGDSSTDMVGLVTCLLTLREMSLTAYFGARLQSFLSFE